MNTFLKLAITALCAFIPCKANDMYSCPRKDYLEGLPDYLEYRSAKDFLTSNETLYLKYLTWTVQIPGIQCVTSTLRDTVELPMIPRWIWYTYAPGGREREQKAITLYMSNETYFTTKAIGHGSLPEVAIITSPSRVPTQCSGPIYEPHSNIVTWVYCDPHDFPRFGDTFPIVFSDSKCLIYYILKVSAFGTVGCALWVKESSKDKPLLHCVFIYLFFCETSYQEVYRKDACDSLVSKSEKRSR
uniref:Putative secreted salivary protein n=1 Tax=Ixodes scapularis TaxID=6945 RepID=Q4PMI4_IXOSC|nr:putative secreted salivary protein [Ixodes scapularis]